MCGHLIVLSSIGLGSRGAGSNQIALDDLAAALALLKVSQSGAASAAFQPHFLDGLPLVDMPDEEPLHQLQHLALLKLQGFQLLNLPLQAGDLGGSPLRNDIEKLGRMSRGKPSINAAG